MRILALDSSAKAGSAAVCEDERILSLFQCDCGNTHSESLLPMALDALRVSGTKLSDIDLFAVSAGPGSFTGVRIGVSVIKGLAFGKNVPVAGVSTLASLAENARGEAGVICPVMDARRGQVYTALFRSGRGENVRLCEDCAADIAALSALWQEHAAEAQQILLVGDGASLVYAKLHESVPSLCLAPDLLLRQNAASVAKVALREYQNGNYVSDIALTPKYLRLPQAERERLEKNNGN